MIVSIKIITYRLIFITLLAFLTIYSCAPTLSKEKIAKANYYYDLGLSHFNNGEFEKALVNYKRAREINPDFHSLHFAMGLLFHQINKLSLAEKHYQKSLDLSKDQPQVINNMGILYMDQKRFKKAITMFKKALSYSSYSTPAFAEANLGWALFITNSKIEGLKHLKLAVDLNPRLCLGHRLLGLAFIKEKKFAEAEKKFRKYSLLCPSADADFRLGQLYQKKEQKWAGQDDKKAMMHFEKCYKQLPLSEIGNRCQQILLKYREGKGENNGTK